MMEETYQQFVSKASAGRKMSVEQLGQLAGGRIWTGRQAKENKLVDEVGTLQDAIQEAKKMAGVAGDEKTELLLLPEPRNLFDDLFGGDMAIQAPAVSRFMGADPALLTRLRNAETWARLLAEPVFLALPYQIEIR
jgi:protease-4